MARGYETARPHSSQVPLTLPDRRHRYYLSNRLVSGRPDPSGWRLPATAFEEAVTHALASHLETTAERHCILSTGELATVSAASDAARTLAERLRAVGAKAAAGLVESGAIGDGRLTMTLSAESLADALKIGEESLNAQLLTLDAPFRICRRGVEVKIVAGERAQVPDATLVRALRNAHRWVAQMKAGTSIRKVARKAEMSESYVARILPLAFLSPRIQQAILSGAHPVDLTLETLVRTRLPVEWSAQEDRLGITARH